MSVKFKAIFLHALEMAKKKRGEKELIDLLKDTHILVWVLMNSFLVKRVKLQLQQRRR